MWVKFEADFRQYSQKFSQSSPSNFLPSAETNIPNITKHKLNTFSLLKSISNSVLLISNQDTNIADIDFILDRYEGQQRDQGIPKDLSVVHLIGHLNT